MTEGPVSAVEETLRQAAAVETLPELVRMREALDAYEGQLRKSAQIRLLVQTASSLGMTISQEIPSVDTAPLALAARALLFVLERTPQDEYARSEPLQASVLVPVPVLEPPVSQADVRAWSEAQNGKLGRITHAPSPPREAARDVLRELLDRLGPVPELSAGVSDLVLIEECDRLDEISSVSSQRLWWQLERDQQRFWVSLLVARERALRIRIEHLSSAKEKLRSVMYRFPGFTREARPGWVNGMRVEHTPSGASWYEDACQFQADLRVMAEGEDPGEDRPDPSDRLREQEKPTETADAEEDEPEELAPLEWPLRARVAAMRVVLYGGEPREQAIVRLQSRLGIGTLEWVEGNRPRRIDALAASVEKGAYQVVVILRFVNHKDVHKLTDAARTAGVPFVFSYGYGTSAIRAALEQALESTKSASTGATP